MAIGGTLKKTVTTTYKQNGLEQRLDAEAQHKFNGAEMTLMVPLQQSPNDLHMMAAMTFDV